MESVCVLRRGCAACIDKKHLIDKTVLGSFLEYGISFLWGGSYPHRLSKSVYRSFIMSALQLDTSINVLLNNFYLWQIFIVKCFKKPLLFRISNLFPKPHEICRLKKKPISSIHGAYRKYVSLMTFSASMRVSSTSLTLKNPPVLVFLTRFSVKQLVFLLQSIPH